jgi:hypothetical protein
MFVMIICFKIYSMSMCIYRYYCSIFIKLKINHNFSLIISAYDLTICITPVRDRDLPGATLRYF